MRKQSKLMLMVISISLMTLFIYAADEVGITVDDQGNVGINKENPNKTLDVNGTANVTGKVTVGGDLDVTGDIILKGPSIKDAGGTIRVYVADNAHTGINDAGGTPRIVAYDNGKLELREDDSQAALIVETNKDVTMTGNVIVDGDIQLKGAEIRDTGGTPRLRVADDSYTSLLDSGGTHRVVIYDDGNLELCEDDNQAALIVQTDKNVRTTSNLLVDGDVRVSGGDITDAGNKSRVRLVKDGNVEIKKSDGTSNAVVVDSSGYTTVTGTLKVEGKIEKDTLYIPPKDFVYIQFPGEKSPAELWPATTWPGVIWTNISSTYAGSFFRAEGGDAKSFNGGKQGDAIRDIEGSIGAAYYSPTGEGSGAFERNTDTLPSSQGSTSHSPYSGFSFKASRVVPTANENRPVNYTIRIWKRTK